METILVEVKSHKARRLIKALEDLHVIKILKRGIREPKLSKKYAGKLPTEVASELQEQLTKNRKGWSHRGI